MDPAGVIERFAACMNGGAVAEAVELYDRDAAFVVEPGRAVIGRRSIEEALSGFVALKPTMRGEIVQIVEAGDVALVVNRWTLDGTDPAGNPVRLKGQSADVLRRSGSSGWRIVIDDPWGGGTS
jgi:ketosteroid isomerase-like protein